MYTAYKKQIETVVIVQKNTYLKCYISYRNKTAIRK